MKLTKEEMLVWMLDKVKSSTDPYDAECWLVTARTLGVNYETDLCAYKLHCQHKNVLSAAETVQRMYMAFSSETRFWDEITQLIEAVRNEAANDEASVFYRAVFHHLLPDFQQTILLDLVEKQKDKVEKCRLLLFLLRLFPDSAETFGEQLIDVLTELAKNAQAAEPHENVYTQLLVCDVLPVLLRSQALELSESVCLELFKRAVRFYLSSVASTQRRKHNPSVVGGTAGVGGSNGASSPRAPRFKSSSRSGETPISDYHHPTETASGGNRSSDGSWDALLQCFSLIADKCHWSVGKKLKSFRLDHLRSIINLFETSSPSKNETIYTSLLVFLNLIFKYSQLMGNSASREGPNVGVALVPPLLRESFVPSLFQTDGPSPKKIPRSPLSFPKDATSIPLIPLDSDKSLADVFSAGTLCLKFLSDKHRDDLVEKLLPADKRIWVKQFIRDSLLLSAGFARISKDLEKKSSGASTIEKVQLSSCYLGLDDSKTGVKTVLELGETLGSSRVGSLQPFASDDWHFAFISEHQTLSYCVRVVIYCLGKKLAESAASSDAILGHSIVLCQYDWPKLIWLFKSSMDHISTTSSQKKRSKFTYPKLFNYVYCVDMLEEIAYLNTNKPTELTLDITETESTRKVGASTRHSVKGQKDDVRSLLEAHASLEGSSMHDVLLLFLNEQKDSLIDLL